VIANVILFLGIAVVGGLGSSWYMIEHGTRLTTLRSGPWVAWSAAGRDDADPYTRAHFLRRGVLPVSTAVALSFQATTDNDGQRLHSSCDYIVEGEEPQAAFWSLGVFNEKGGLIANAAERHAFNSATIMRPPSGRLDVRLARHARPGNWLPTGGAGRVVLELTIEEPKAGADSGKPIALPQIRRLACR
jgi:hypothetical protein